MNTEAKTHEFEKPEDGLELVAFDTEAGYYKYQNRDGSIGFTIERAAKGFAVRNRMKIEHILHSPYQHRRSLDAAQQLVKGWYKEFVPQQGHGKAAELYTPQGQVGRCISGAIEAYMQLGAPPKECEEPEATEKPYTDTAGAGPSHKQVLQRAAERLSEKAELERLIQRNVDAGYSGIC